MKSVRVLLADDHEVVRRGVRAILETRADYEVVGEATNGRDAVEMASSLKPDVVVLDISMEGMNGLEATRQIVKASPGTKVLVLTMHDSESIASQALEAGAHGYLSKSDAGRDLVLALDALRMNKPFFTSKVWEMMVRDGAKGGSHLHRHTRLQSLTAREREVLQLLAEAKSNKEVAQVLGLSVKTVDAHRTKIMSKLGLHSVAELVRFAVREGVIDP